jgi:hypothetical protein
METELAVPAEENGTDDAKTIWRYMDLPRFVSLLSTCGLWFAKASSLHDDPYEGFGKAQRLVLQMDDAPTTVAHTGPDGKRNISLQEMVAGFSQRSADIFENAREHLYVNSWCLGASESMAMWQIYGSVGRGVAVKSSVGQYQRAAKFAVDSSHYVFGDVTYHHSLESAPDVQRDFRDSIPVPGLGLRSEVLKLGLHKRSCYEYEREWRAVIYQDPRPEKGVHERFDLEQLITEVYVGPRAEQFLVDVVSSIMDKFLIQKPLKRSLLLSSPRGGVIG